MIIFTKYNKSKYCDANKVCVKDYFIQQNISNFSKCNFSAILNVSKAKKKFVLKKYSPQII